MSTSPPYLRRGAACALGLALVALLPLSAARSQGRDPAGAEKLYDDGAKLLAAGDWAGACAKFDQSFALDAAPGTLLNLASCAEHDGKLALAWSRLKDARSLNADTKSEKQRKEIESFIASAIKRLEPRLPYLTIRVAGDVSGLVVTRDGQATAPGVELPVDPGTHVIEVSAPGYRTAKREVVSKEATRESVEITLEKASDVAPAPTASASAAPTTTSTSPPPVPPPPKADDRGLGTLQIAGIVVGSVGVASLVVAIGTGVVAKSKESDLNALGCPTTSSGSLSCNADVAPQADALSSDGSTLAVASTVTTFVGAALAGTGIVLLVVGSIGGSNTGEAATLAPYFDPHGGGLTFGGRF